MIKLIPIVCRTKSKGYKGQANKKLILNSQLQTHQILTNDDQMLILCLSYFITTVSGNRFVAEDQDSDKSSSNSRNKLNLFCGNYSRKKGTLLTSRLYVVQSFRLKNFTVFFKLKI